MHRGPAVLEVGQDFLAVLIEGAHLLQALGQVLLQPIHVLGGTTAVGVTPSVLSLAHTLTVSAIVPVGHHNSPHPRPHHPHHHRRRRRHLPSSLQAHSERVAPVLYARPGPAPYRDRLLVLHVHCLEMFDHLQRKECCSMWLPSSPTLADTAGMPWQSAQGALGVLCCTEADGWGGGRAALIIDDAAIGRNALPG